MKKLLGLILVAALLMAMPMGMASAEELDQETLNAGDIVIRYSWWSDDVTAQIMIKAMDAYTAMYPNITFEPEYQGFDGYQEKMMTQLAGGTEPDIITVDQPWMAELAKSDVFVDLNEYKDIFDPENTMDQGQIEKFCIYDGKMLGASNGSNGYCGILMNKAAEDVGFDMSKYGDTGITWDVMIEEGERIHNEHPDYYLSSTDVPGLWLCVKTMLKELSGNNVVNDDYTFGFTEDQLLKVYQTVDALYKKGALEPMAQSQLYHDRRTENPLFASGHTVMSLDWMVSNVYSYVNFLPEGESTSAFLFPHFGDLTNGSAMIRPNHIMCVSKNSPNVREVVKFMNWMLTSPEACEIIGIYKGYSTCSTWNELYAGNEELCPSELKKAFDISMPNILSKESSIIGNAELERAWWDEISKLAYGELTPEEAVASSMTNISDLLEQMKENA